MSASLRQTVVYAGSEYPCGLGIIRRRRDTLETEILVLKRVVPITADVFKGDIRNLRMNPRTRQ